MNYFSHRPSHSSDLKNLTGFGMHHKKIHSIGNLNVNLSEIHDILKKNIGKSSEKPKNIHHRSTSNVSNFSKKIKFFSLTKQKLSPCVYRPLTIRCQSPTLRFKRSKKKIISTPNNFIVTKLKTPVK